MAEREAMMQEELFWEVHDLVKKIIAKREAQARREVLEEIKESVWLSPTMGEAVMAIRKLLAAEETDDAS